TSPFSRTAIRMLPDSRYAAVSACGRPTTIPASFTNEVVMMKKIKRFSTKSSIGARSMPWGSVSGLWWWARIPARFSSGRAERNVVDAGEMDLIDHLNDHPSRCRTVGGDENPDPRVRRVDALDVRSHRPHIHHAPVEPDLAVGSYGDQNARCFR